MIEARNKLQKLSGHRPGKKTLVIIVIASLLATTGYFGWQFYMLKNDKNTQNKALAADVKTKVGKIYALPTDEEPTVARIENKDSLKDQNFFDKAQNGDYVIVYEKAKLALLYRDQDGKLINVGPISTDSAAASTTDKTTEKTTSTTTPGVTKDTAKKQQ